ncbi:MAG: hypothetical protein ACO34E_10310 [Limisphaerales bacterium]
MNSQHTLIGLAIAGIAGSCIAARMLRFRNYERVGSLASQDSKPATPVVFEPRVITSLQLHHNLFATPEPILAAHSNQQPEAHQEDAFSTSA